MRCRIMQPSDDSWVGSLPDSGRKETHRPLQNIPYGNTSATNCGKVLLHYHCGSLSFDIPNTLPAWTLSLIWPRRHTNDATLGSTLHIVALEELLLLAGIPMKGGMVILCTFSLANPSMQRSPQTAPSWSSRNEPLRYCWWHLHDATSEALPIGWTLFMERSSSSTIACFSLPLSTSYLAKGLFAFAQSLSIISYKVTQPQYSCWIPNSRMVTRYYHNLSVQLVVSWTRTFPGLARLRKPRLEFLRHTALWVYDSSPRCRVVRALLMHEPLSRMRRSMLKTIAWREAWELPFYPASISPRSSDPAHVS